MVLPLKCNLLGRNFGFYYILLRTLQKRNLIFSATWPLFGEEGLSVQVYLLYRSDTVCMPHY